MKFLGRSIRNALEGVRPPAPPYSRPAHEAITAELVRLSLPHHPSTDRPELKVA